MSNIKHEARGRLLRLMTAKNMSRGMTLIEEQSRCVRRDEIHELVTTDQLDVAAGSVIQRVGFLGFAEFQNAGVIEVGDSVTVGEQEIGKVVGFDSCHFPNHYNILIGTTTLLTASELQARVGDSVVIGPNQRVTVPLDAARASLVVGCGHSGMDFHIPSIERLRVKAGLSHEEWPVYLVDPRPNPRLVQGSTGHIWGQEASVVPEPLRANTVVHLCTPPSVRVKVLEQCLELGFKRFILEKPMVADAEGLEHFLRLRERYSADILVITNWLSSSLSKEILKVIRSDAGPCHILIRQKKSRIGRSRDNATHTSAFDVEVPHLVALALFLGGTDASVSSAHCWDMELDDLRIARMGGAAIRLAWPNGSTAELSSDLMSPVAERRIDVQLSSGEELVAHYPYGSRDLDSTLCRRGANGAVRQRNYFHDDTLISALQGAYAYFFEGGARPASDADFHLAVCALLNRAREVAMSNAASHFAVEDAPVERRA